MVDDDDDDNNDDNYRNGKHFADNNLLRQLFGEGWSYHEEGEKILPFMGLQVCSS